MDHPVTVVTMATRDVRDGDRQVDVEPGSRPDTGAPVVIDDTARRPAPGGRSVVRRLLPPLVVIVAAGAISVTYLGAGLWGTGTWRGNVGDPEQFMWFLSWVPHALAQGHNPLLSDFQLYPHGTNLTWNTSVVLPSLLAAPVTMVAGPVVSFNLLLVLGPIATSATAYWAFRRYVDSPLAAGVGALAFAFCPFFLLHASGHLHLVLLALVPVILVLSDEILVRQRRRPLLIGGLTGLVATLQLLTSEEVLAIEAVTGGLAVLILWRLHRHAVRPRAGYVCRAAVGAAVTFAVLAGYPLCIQLFGPRRAPGAHGSSTYSTDLLNLVWPVNQWFDLGIGKPSFTGNPSEWTGYLGVPLIALLIVVSARAWRRCPLVPVAALLVAALVVLSFGPLLHVAGHTTFVPLPWVVATRLPLLDNLLPGRISVVVALFAALLLAVFVDELVKVRRRRAKLAGAALVALAALSWVPGGLRTTTIRTPEFFTTAAQNRIPAGSVALVVPYVKGPDDEQAALWQANGGMRFRMVDGWMIVPGPHWGGADAISRALDRARTITVTRPLRDAIVNELRVRRVRTVILGPTPRRARDISLFTRVFDRPPVPVGGVELWTVP